MSLVSYAMLFIMLYLTLHYVMFLLCYNIYYYYLLLLLCCYVTLFLLFLMLCYCYVICYVTLAKLFANGDIHNESNSGLMVWRLSYPIN